MALTTRQNDDLDSIGLVEPLDTEDETTDEDSITESPLEFRVRIHDGVALCIRSSPDDAEDNVIGITSIHQTEPLVVLEEKNGFGNIGGNHWINISSKYVTRV